MADRSRAITGFHHVAIGSKDFDASVRFYTEGLGLRATTRWGEGAGRAVMLAAPDGRIVEVFASGNQGGEGPLLHFALTSDDVDAAVARARAAGAQITMEPRDVDIPSDPPAPVRIAFCKGPDGEVIEFFQNR